MLDEVVTEVGNEVWAKLVLKHFHFADKQNDLQFLCFIFTVITVPM